MILIEKRLNVFVLKISEIAFLAFPIRFDEVMFREDPECRFRLEMSFGKIPIAVFSWNRASEKSRLPFLLENAFRENPVCRFLPEMGFGRIPFVAFNWKWASGESRLSFSLGNELRENPVCRFQPEMSFGKI